MTRRPATVLATLVLAGTALLTGCGPSGSGAGADKGAGAADSGQVQDMQHKLDAAESAAAQADADTAADNG
ncbi:hypothetical protein ACIRS1_05930 [Kitasatospora sp. NPDC101176]|uniref:hypothetical protein n=1 Tax=Kitasatospora sp. NPDC101176 TaxID=3364099 RepID=UPI003810F475